MQLSVLMAMAVWFVSQQRERVPVLLLDRHTEHFQPAEPNGGLSAPLVLRPSYVQPQRSRVSVRQLRAEAAELCAG